MFLTGDQAGYALFASVGYVIYLCAPKMSGWQKTAYKIGGVVIMISSLLLAMFPSFALRIHNLLVWTR